MADVIIDSTNDEMGFGQDVEDSFHKVRNCLDWRLNHPNTPDCLIGYANRDILKGEQLCAEHGKEYWLPRHRISDLHETMMALCMKYYRFTEHDIVE